MGELSVLVLHSQKVLPEVAEKAGYKFQFSEVQSALNDLAQKKSSPKKLIASASH
jgi:NAD dependent epimerase/dehydratase family enzyme